MTAPRPPLAPDADDARYRAMAARDARFDGRFFTGVTSTGIYCRPVCAVRTPRRENCRFFVLAAQAESAGFRPCLRCRPELAPRALAWSVQDAPDILVREALRLLEGEGAWEASATGPSPLQRLAARLGVSDRHLRRIFETALGVSPLQYLQTRRLLAAKQLLTDTDLPVTQVALASGFGSVRRFNAAFAGHYGLNPTQLRKTGAGTAAGGASSTVRLAYRPPLDVPALLAFFAKRQIHAVESVSTEGEQTLRRTVRLVVGGQVHAGWLSARFDPDRPQVLLQTSDNLHPVLPLVIARVRALLDLDADPQAINAVLHGAFPEGDGLRVPGAFDGFELAVRAVLGQQITVAAARTLAQRLMERFGEPIDTPWPALTRLFPSPAVLAGAAGDALGQLGIVRQRQAAIVALAQAVDSGRLALHGAADVAATTAALCELPGIGDWTAQYIAMRALRWPDAFPAGDVALHKALGVQGAPRAAQAATAASHAWRPWRSYAVIRAWTLGSTPAASGAPTPQLLPKT
ncbi:AlkA N-terminal domain-containing protein [Acidovorax sp. BLS4]|uniref:AlkA N-terminal domain-containing protein n=1 Tax=Acidovorax sp. BLS4 TaxID=3273430 RepID=UPI002943C330|nr:AlkA N-terminal domain-containing protein [Paracidovorax avenae]WOI45073.1 AlkA N-terminal domain-containing protein [Paracidovorax avenae]